MCSCSTVQVDISKARMMAETKLKQIALRRKRDWATEILMKQGERNRLRRWFFWLKPLSVEEAKMDIRMSWAGSPDLHYWRTENAAKAVLTLCSCAFAGVSCVTLDSETLRQLQL